LTLQLLGVPSVENSTCTSVIWSALSHKSSPSFRNCGIGYLPFQGFTLGVHLPASDRFDRKTSPRLRRTRDLGARWPAVWLNTPLAPSCLPLEVSTQLLGGLAVRVGPDG